jgi:hypothetical protein
MQNAQSLAERTIDAMFLAAKVNAAVALTAFVVAIGTIWYTVAQH